MRQIKWCCSQAKAKKKLKIPRDASILTVLKNAQQHIVGAATNWLKAFVSDNLLKWTSSTCKFEENHFSFPKTWLLLGKMSSTRCELGEVSFQGRLPNENWQLVQRVSSVNRSKAFPRLKNSSISQSHKSILEKKEQIWFSQARKFILGCCQSWFKYNLVVQHQRHCCSISSE